MRRRIKGGEGMKVRAIKKYSDIIQKKSSRKGHRIRCAGGQGEVSGHPGHGRTCKG